MCDDIGGVILAGSYFWGGHDPPNPPTNYAPVPPHVISPTFLWTL